VATRELIDCIDRTLSFSQADCNGISGLVLLNCSNQLIKANSCGTAPPEMCTESLQVTGNQCVRTRVCGASIYQTTCSSANAFTGCSCQVNGATRSKMGYSGMFDACERAQVFPCP
jgi:hypothetical protein